MSFGLAALILLAACEKEGGVSESGETTSASSCFEAAPSSADSVSSEDSAVPSEDSAVPSEDSAVPSEDSAVPSEDSAVSSEDSADFAPESAACVFRGGIYDGREEIKLVALGDSIARGYALEDPEKQSYPALICEALREGLEGTAVNYANCAVDGDTTSDLLKLLESGAPELEGADIVLLSIGANNILQPFLSSLSQLSEALRRGSGGSPEESDFMRRIFSEANDFFKSAAFSKTMSDGVDSVERELKQVLKRIKTRAPDAFVMLMTVYSPYHGMNITLPYIGQSLPLGDLSDKWVSELNSVISGASREAGCALVDSYAPFQKSRGLVNAGISILPPRFSFDPHPNSSGHLMLANLHIAALAKTGEAKRPPLRKEKLSY